MPWRFSDAGCRSAWLDRRRRRPKTCTLPAALRRLIASDEKGVTFKWKDYRREGRERYQVMTLATHEFIRRFLMHVLPAGFHRIRYYGLLASGKRAENIARARELLTLPIPSRRCHQSSEHQRRGTAKARAFLPALRRPHDHHRAVRTRSQLRTTTRVPQRQ